MNIIICTRNTCKKTHEARNDKQDDLYKTASQEDSTHPLVNNSIAILFGLRLSLRMAETIQTQCGVGSHELVFQAALLFESDIHVWSYLYLHVSAIQVHVYLPNVLTWSRVYFSPKFET